MMLRDTNYPDTDSRRAVMLIKLQLLEIPLVTHLKTPQDPQLTFLSNSLLSLVWYLEVSSENTEVF